jgi:hypothetical protein
VFVLESKLVLDLLKLGLNPWVGLVAMRVQFGEVAQTLFNTALIDEPSRAFRKEEDKRSEKDGRNDLNTKTGAPLATVGRIKTNISACRVSVVVSFPKFCSHTVRNPASSKSTNTQHELLERSDTTTDIRMRQFTLVNGDDHNF